MLDIPAARFASWTGEQQGFAVLPGEYELRAGAASDDIRLRARLRL
jgi:hypothetical protein